jgi:hypothetical protein
VSRATCQSALRACIRQGAPVTRPHMTCWAARCLQGAIVNTQVARAPGSDDGPAFTSSISRAANLYLYTALQSVVVSAINIVVALAIEYVSLAERHVTTTSYLAGFVTKLTIFYLLNSFVVPIIAVVTLTGSDKVWCALARLPCSSQNADPD